MTRPIDTLLFDFGGTLDADGIAWKERFHVHYRAEGLDVEAEAFAPVFYAADDPLVGGLPMDADLEATVERLTVNLEDALERRGVAARDSARGRRVALRFLADAAAAFRRNRPLVEALGGRYRLGIVSNFYGNLDAVCRGAGLAPLIAVDRRQPARRRREARSRHLPRRARAARRRAGNDALRRQFAEARPSRRPRARHALPLGRARRGAGRRGPVPITRRWRGLDELRGRLL